MSTPSVVWLNTSLSMRCFAQPLLDRLSQQITVAQWNYHQDWDKECSLEKAMLQLHSYLNGLHHPVHLIGHGTSGLLGLLYTRQYPNTVQSLTLLAVGIDIAVDWQFHYYLHRAQLSREKLLTAMVYHLFGYQDRQSLDGLANLLEQDLECSLSPHSLFRRLRLLPCEVPVPLMVCGSQDDLIVDSDNLRGWQPFLKESDCLWSCQEGRHFFHFSQATLLAEQVFNFWNSCHSEVLVRPVL